MYFRYCWKQTRGRWIGALMLFTALGLLSARVSVPSPARMAENIRRFHHWRWTWQDAWTEGANMFTAFACFLGVLVGMGIGASGVGEDCSRQAEHFLFTRPRSRRYFVWTGWLAGVSQICFVIFVGSATLGISLGLLTHHFVADLLLSTTARILVPATVALSLSHCLTALGRNPRNGILSTAGVYIAGLVLSVLLGRASQLKNISDMIGDLFSYTGQGLGWRSLCCQAMLAGLLALLTHTAVERMEV